MRKPNGGLIEVVATLVVLGFFIRYLPIIAVVVAIIILVPIAIAAYRKKK